MISDIVMEIRNGIFNRFDELVDYYYSYVLSKPDFNGVSEETKNKAKEYIERIIKHYFEAGINMVFTQYMTNYLNRYVKINGKNCKKKKKQIDDIENYYTEIIYNKINQITKVLNEEEKLKLAKELFLHYKQSYKDDRSYYLSVYIQNRISSMFDCNKRNTVEDKILLTYSFYIGMTDKIHQYFFEKYALVAKKLGVTYKDSDFSTFISEFISKENYSQHSINNAMENNLKFLLETQNQDLVKKKPPEIKDGKNANREYYSYIKEKEYKKFEKNFEDKELLRKIIEIKYNNAIDIYFSKEHKSYLTRYIFTCLNDYLTKLCERNEESKNMVLFYANNYTGSIPKNEIINILNERKQQIFYEFYIDNLNRDNMQFFTYLKNELEKLLYFDEDNICLTYKEKGHSKDK